MGRGPGRRSASLPMMEERRAVARLSLSEGDPVVAAANRAGFNRASEPVRGVG